MAESSIPVDLFNPGQVFACLGFLEAADVLCGDATGGFDWSAEEDVRFCLRAGGDENPFKAVLGFLANTKPRRWGPVGYSEPSSQTRKKGKVEEEHEIELHAHLPSPTEQGHENGFAHLPQWWETGPQSNLAIGLTAPVATISSSMRATDLRIRLPARCFAAMTRRRKVLSSFGQKDETS